MQVPEQAGAGRRPLDDPSDHRAAKATLPRGIGVSPVAGQAWVVWGVCVGSRRRGLGGLAVNTHSLRRSVCAAAPESPPSPVPGPSTPQPGEASMERKRLSDTRL